MRCVRLAFGLPDAGRLVGLGLLIVLAGCSVPASATSTCDAVGTLDSGLAAHWTFDRSTSLDGVHRLRALQNFFHSAMQSGGDAGGAEANAVVGDTSGHALYGVARNAGFSSDVPRPALGKAISLNGRDSFVGIPNVKAPNDVTLSLWLNQESSKLVDVFGSASPQANSPGEFALGIEADGRLTYIRWVQGNGDRPHVSVVAPPHARLGYGVWHHVAGVYRLDEGFAGLYLDGKQIASAKAVTYSSSWRGGIGKGEPDGKYYFNGKMADVRVYDRALSADEVAALADGCAR